MSFHITMYIATIASSIYKGSNNKVEGTALRIIIHSKQKRKLPSRLLIHRVTSIKILYIAKDYEHNLVLV